MFKNHADASKNRLYVNFFGKMETDEIRKACNNALDETKKLKPGFGIISDISTFVPTSEEGRLEMQGAMKKLKEMGASHVVRIVTAGATVTALQWQRTSRSIGYEADQAPSLPEAEAMMDKIMAKG
jgi:hypothetical protein